MKRPRPIKLLHYRIARRIEIWKAARARAKHLEDSLVLGLCGLFPWRDIQAAERGPAYLLRNEKNEPIKQVTVEPPWDSRAVTVAHVSPDQKLDGVVHG